MNKKRYLNLRYLNHLITLLNALFSLVGKPLLQHYVIHYKEKKKCHVKKSVNVVNLV